MPATPGTSTDVTVDPAIGLTASVTWDPPVGIEAGRTIVEPDESKAAPVKSSAMQPRTGAIFSSQMYLNFYLVSLPLYLYY